MNSLIKLTKSLLPIFVTSVVLIGTTSIAGEDWVHPQANSYESGFLRGLKLAGDVLETEFWSGWDNNDVLIRTFEVRRDKANLIAGKIEANLSEIQNDGIRHSLVKIINKIRSAPQNGYGDKHYWINALKSQTYLFNRSAYKIDTLAATYVHDKTIYAKRELGYLHGLKIAFKALTEFSSTEHDRDMMYRTYKLRKKAAKAVAFGMQKYMGLIQDQSLRAELYQLSNELIIASKKDPRFPNDLPRVLAVQHERIMELYGRLKGIIDLAHPNGNVVLNQPPRQMMSAAPMDAQSCQRFYGL